MVVVLYLVHRIWNVTDEREESKMHVFHMLGIPMLDNSL